MSSLTMEDRLKRHRLLGKYIAGEIIQLKPLRKDQRAAVYVLMTSMERATVRPSVLRGSARLMESAIQDQVILALPKNLTPELAFTLVSAMKGQASIELNVEKMLFLHARDRLQELGAIPLPASARAAA